MATVKSQDGTHIAFDETGEGPALILVVGAFNTRGDGAPLAHALAPHFTVFNYDRRGRGDSGDTAPYAVEREIDDLAALIAAAGGSARVVGYSSGAILALRAAAHGLAITQLALYEPPPTGGRAAELVGPLTQLMADERRGEAVELFQTEAVGIPAEVVAELRHAPFRPALEKMAQTLIYEATVLQALPAELLASVTIPAFVLDGEASPPVMRRAAQALAANLPDGRYRSLPGQGHAIVPEALAPVLQASFLG